MKILIKTFLFISFSVASTSLANASESSEALQHANAALQSGQSGDVKMLVKHAEFAMENALAASLTGNGPVVKNMGAASEKLQEAVDHGNLGHAEIASKFVEEAISYIQQAQ